MADLKLIETGDGGDVVLLGNDLQVITGFQNMPYIGMFGGNVEADTEGPKPENEQAFDFWGNNLLFPNDQSIQFNSEFERRLTEVALNSAGRLQLEQSAKRDLDFMSDFAIVDIETAITDNDRLEMLITIQEPDNLSATEY